MKTNEVKNKEKDKPLQVFKYSEAVLPLKAGEFSVTVFHDNQSDSESIAIHQGLSLPSDAPLFTRVHSECLTGEVLDSLKCDCRDQLSIALSTIADLGRGIVIYLRQEGRGIGLGNKIKAYDLQRKGFDTIDANLALGFDVDSRDFSIAGEILKSLDIESISLNTNNPDKISTLKQCGINVENVTSSHAPIHDLNRGYLQTKKEKMGHFLDC